MGKIDTWEITRATVMEHIMDKGKESAQGYAIK